MQDRTFRIDDKDINDIDWYKGLQEGSQVIVETQGAWFNKPIYHHAKVKDFSYSDELGSFIVVAGSDRAVGISRLLPIEFAKNSDIVKNYIDAGDDLNFIITMFNSMNNEEMTLPKEQEKSRYEVIQEANVIFLETIASATASVTQDSIQ